MTAEAQFARAAVFPEIDRIHAVQTRAVAGQPPPGLEQRIAMIERLEEALLARRGEIHAALRDDFRKPAAEVDLSEIYPVLGETRHARRHLWRWMRPRRVPTPLGLIGSRSSIVYEPKGMVLILSPWNFPINLSLGPLVSALAAGNRVILKPSEMTPHASACLRRVLEDLFDETQVAVIEGDAATGQALLEKRFDHIFFTGSPRVGRIVMRAAAEHLTPVTLELGGKSPVIVDRTANLDEAAKKIAWGKTVNSGQICVAPDYVLVDETVAASFSEKLREAFAALGGERSGLVNGAHAARVQGMIDEAVAGGATVVAGGAAEEGTIAPVVLANVPHDARLMREEIFGPALPMVAVRSIDEAVAFIAAREKPLVLYLFSRNRRVVRDVIRQTRAGGSVINDTLVHFYQVHLPFGGVGESGIGKAHGRFGFETFSNARGILEQRTRWSAIQMMYPPYTKVRKRLIDFALKYL